MKCPLRKVLCKESPHNLINVFGPFSAINFHSSMSESHCETAQDHGELRNFKMSAKTEVAKASNTQFSLLSK